DDVPGDELPPCRLVGSDDVAGEIGIGVALTAVAGRNEGRVDAGAPSGNGDAVFFADEVLVHFPELGVVAGVGQVAFVAAVVVEAAERWGIDGCVDRVVRQFGHYFHGVAVVDGVPVGDYLVFDNIVCISIAFV